MTDPVHDFTLEPLVWKPYLQPVSKDEATPEQIEAIATYGPIDKVSDYVKVLAHDAEILNERTPLFNDIMYNQGGLSRGYRELGALGASVVNGCVYCAFVHGNRFNAAEKRTDIVAAIFERGSDADLPPREQAIFDFAVTLTESLDKITSIGGHHIYNLRMHGLSDLEILDLIHATAIFGWANRLMHTLGAAYRRS